jgi:methionyl-tRNA formyltransferase
VNVLLIAEESAGMQALRCVTRTGHRVVAVLTSGRGTDPRGSSVRTLAQQLGVAVWPPTLVRDPAFAAKVLGEGVELLLNVHSPFAVHEAVAVAATRGAFNFHPGPLPQYAGQNVVSWALYNGETTHGATLHWLTGDVDGGAIAYDASFRIEEHDTALTVFAKCVSAGMPLVERLLDDTAAGTVPRIAQDVRRRRSYGSQVPQDGWISWTCSAREIANFVRACDYAPFRSPWGQPRARVRGTEFTLLKAGRTHNSCSAQCGTVGAIAGRGVSVAAADEWVLIDRVCIDGRNFDAADLLHPGDFIEDRAYALPPMAAS